MVVLVYDDCKHDINKENTMVIFNIFSLCHWGASMPRQGSITQHCIHELFEQFHVVQVGKEVFHE